MLTADSCRAPAADDTLRAGTSDPPNRRAHFEVSAAAWNKGADMLERIGRPSAAGRAPEGTFDRA